MNRDILQTHQLRDPYQNRFSNHNNSNPYSDVYTSELRPARGSSQENRQPDGNSRSSGIEGLPENPNDEVSSDSRTRMLRGSLESSQGIGRPQLRNQDIKNSDDLTLEMLGPTNNRVPQNFTSFEPRTEGSNGYNYVPQNNTKGPPSSALDLHSELHQDHNFGQNQFPTKNVSETLTLEQYRQNNQSLQQILQQLDSTPQFNSAQQIVSNYRVGGSVPLGQNLTSATGSRSRATAQLAQINEVNEVKPFTYSNESRSKQSNAPRFGNPNEQLGPYSNIREDLTKIDLLQQAIQNQAQNQQAYKRTELQSTGSQIVQKENRNKQNQFNQAPPQVNLQIEKTKSTPAPQHKELLNEHQKIMKHFDDIPISRIKTMVGYQTNPDMYNSEAKIKDQQPEEQPVQPEPTNQNKESKLNEDYSDGDDDSRSLDERVMDSMWKVRLRAFKEINQLFYNDYAKFQSDSNHQMTSFDQFGPLLQEMIKDTNLTNAYEALQCLYSYVRFANDIKAITFASHNYLLEKVQTNKPNFREITLKILIGMLRRDQGASCLYPELQKRFRSKNSKCAHFCMLVVIEAFKTKEQNIIQDMNLRQIFKSIQESITHHNKDLREASYQILKYLFERCKDDVSVVIQNCKNLRPVQVKELSEELQKLEKVHNVTFTLIDQNDFQDDSSNPIRDALPPKHQKTVDFAEEKHESKVTPVQPVEQEYFDLLTLVPEDFSEIPYMQQINAKKRSMELFNIELSKVMEKGSNALIKQKDYSLIFNTVLHMLEDKNMLVFLEAIKSVELLAILQQIKAAKAKPFINVLAGKYGETKTAVIAATDKAMAAIVIHSLSPAVFSDICINQIASTHKNPRVKLFIITNTIQNMLKSLSGQDAENIQTLVSVLKQIKEKLVLLIKNDTNNSVRDAAVQLLIDFGLQLQQDQNAYQSVITAIQVLPKYRIAEIMKKLEGKTSEEPLVQQQAFSKTMAQQKQPIQTAVDEEFSKTLAPQAQPDLKSAADQKQPTIIDALKGMELGKMIDPNSIQQRLQQATQQENAFLKKNRKGVLQSILNLCYSKSKILNLPKVASHLTTFLNELIQLAPLTADLDQNGVIMESVLILVAHQTDHTIPSEILQQIMFTHPDVRDFCDHFREVIELPSIIEHYRAVAIITFVYSWLGQRLENLLHLGMDTVELEELRGFGIKYLESTHLFNEQQRQQLIQIMLKFKDQVQVAKHSALQTLGQEPIESSIGSSKANTKLQTAQWRPQTTEEITPNPEITAELICKTIDLQFEQGLLMFKELAQSKSTLDFDTKDQIFKKLLSIVSEGQKTSNMEQQQYRQAYALKALMWMKEETMGLDDTFKLTHKVINVYLSQIYKEIDASVELYLLNFWVKDLSIRDIADRIALSVTEFKDANSKSSHRSSSQQTKGQSVSDEQLDAFNIIFAWFDEHWLVPQSQNWKLGDLRKIALLICESIIYQKNKNKVETFKSFLKVCVEKESQEKVLEFMEIQLMHSKEVFIQFLDWFQSHYPSKIQAKPVQTHQLPPPIANTDPRPVSSLSQSKQLQESQNTAQATETLQNSQQHLSYIERRQQKKAINKTKQTQEDIEQSQQQIREIINKIEESGVIQATERVEAEIEQAPIQRQTHTSGFGKSQKSRYDQEHSSEEQDEHEISIEEKKVEPPRRIQSAVSQNRDIYERVQQSEVKQQAWMSKIRELEAEKERIELETEQLQQQKNQESQLWQSKLQRMQQEHQNVIANLSEVNQCYLQQVEENESLKSQLVNMQKQHNDMMVRFEQIERKINSRDTERITPATPPRNQVSLLQNRENLTMSVAKLKRISDTFSLVDQKIGVQKIQELLLSVERNVDGELAQPLISHYVKMKTFEERHSMIIAVSQALSLNEDVLLALSVDVYKALLNFLLRAFAHEKERLDTQSIGGNHKIEQNEITLESQKMVSRLLNSKDFTTSLVSLFQLLREAMPADLALQLPLEERQYIRVLMRCIQRITKALHSEAVELVRGFDVLIEMQKMFLKCPPENLREDLPCLADFDFVFRGMKDVSDKLVELQPDKVQSFLDYSQNSNENAFIKYLTTMSNRQ